MDEIVLSGPIRADLIKMKNKRLLFLSDCHMIGNGCTNSSSLTESICSIFTNNSEKDFLLLIEGSLDILSIQKDLDLVKFAHDMSEVELDNVRLEYTDVRRCCNEDKFWIEDFLINFPSKKNIDLETIVKIFENEYPDLVQTKLLNEMIPFLKKIKIYSYLNEKFEKLIKKFFLQTSNENFLILLTSWIMDCFTIYLIFSSREKNIIYYAGELHINNLLKIFEEIDPNLERFQAKTKFSQYCEKRNCKNPNSRDIKKALDLENSRCLILKFSIEDFFI